MPVLTVVIPCYNEAKRLPPLFSLIAAERERDWEWLFVDDGSIDDTAARIAEFADRHPGRVTLLKQARNFGKGRAVRDGILAAKGDLVGFVDADLAASPLEFARFLVDPELLDGQELLIGIRVKTHDGMVKRLLYRHIMGRAFQTFTSIVTGLTVYDTQCGFKLISREAGRRVAAEMQCDGFAFDVEMIMVACHQGLRIREEMIHWEEKGDSRVRPRHILQMARDILRFRRRLGKTKSRAELI
jgi:dolichyl-phosphate beta-glucosyltransferase